MWRPHTTARRDQVLAILGDNPTIWHRASTVAPIIGKSVAIVTGDLHALATAGLVERHLDRDGIHRFRVPFTVSANDALLAALDWETPAEADP